MDALLQLKKEIKEAINDLFGYAVPDEHLVLSPTKKEFEGDVTLVVFPLVKVLKKSPQDIANSIGESIMAKSSFVKGFNVIKGFLNFEFSSETWNQLLQLIHEDGFHVLDKKNKKILVEYSSPNTNKPLHLGHLRNILLGWSVAQIANACGYDVIKTQIINDRGIAICKSMMAWTKFGEGATPESSSTKGDFFVGHYYVLFEQKFQAEYAEWQSTAEAKSLFCSQVRWRKRGSLFQEIQKSILQRL